MLQGHTSLKIIVDEREITKLAKQIDRSLNSSAVDIVNAVASASVDYLAALERGLHRNDLAGWWTHTPVQVQGYEISCEVFNQAETKTFNKLNFEGSPVASWSINGTDLLKILEAGAAPHVYGPNKAMILAFQSEIGVRSSMFAGAIRAGVNKKSGVFANTFVNPNRFQDAIFTMQVDHPGVTGDHFVELTGVEMRSRIIPIATARLLSMRVEQV